MPSPDPTPSRPSPRIWFVLAGVLLVLALVTPWPRPPVGKTDRNTSNLSANTIVPSKTLRAASARAKNNAASSFQRRIWTVPADFTEYLWRLPYNPNAPHDDSSGPVDPFAPNPAPQRHGPLRPRGGGGIDPFAPDSDPFAPDALSPSLHVPRMNLYLTVQPALIEHGVPFPPGASATLDQSTGRLEVRNTSANLDLVDEIIDAIGPMEFWTLDPTLFRSNTPPPDPRLEINALKLKSIIIPEVDFNGITIGEAIALLNQRAREMDPDGVGVPLRLQDSFSPPHGETDSLARPDSGSATIRELKLKNVPLAVVLQYMCDSSAIRYRIDPEGVTLVTLQPSGSPPATLTRRWHVDPSLIARLRTPPPNIPDNMDPFAPDVPMSPTAQAQLREQLRNRPLMDICKDQGMSFPPQSDIRYSPATSTLTVTNTPANLDFAEAMCESLAIEESKARAGF